MWEDGGAAAHVVSILMIDIHLQQLCWLVNYIGAH